MNDYSVNVSRPSTFGPDGTFVLPEVVWAGGKEDVALVMVARLSCGQDDQFVEFVDGTADGLNRSRKWVINVSTQFGCPVGCRFCDAGVAYRGDLTAAQILGQVVNVLQSRPGLSGRCDKLKVHFSRMGEPTLNPAVVVAIDSLAVNYRTAGMWACVATTAPVAGEGVLNELIAVAHRRWAGRFQLQFSVNSTCESTRAKLMPIPLLPLERLAYYSKLFTRADERKVVLNFAMTRGAQCAADVLARHFSPDDVVVKLTPVNPTSARDESGLGSVLRSEDDNEATLFAGALRSEGFEVILSVGDVAEDLVGSNCGQAVGRYVLEQARAAVWSKEMCI